MKIALGIFIAITVITVNSLEQTEETGLKNVEEIGLARANRSPEAKRKRKYGNTIKKNNKCMTKCNKSKNKDKCKKCRRKERKRRKQERKRQQRKKKKENKDKEEITKKRRRKNNRKKPISRQTSDSVCVENIITTMGYVGNQIKNFNQQKNRLEAFEKIVTKKGGKKDNFANATSYLGTVAGNNTCGSSSSSANATSNFNTLNNCSSSIGDSCVIPPGTINASALTSCETSLKKVTTKQDDCYTKTVAVSNGDFTAVCTCWSEAAALVNTTKALKCSALSTLNAVKVHKKSCQSKFGECKSAEDEAPGLINTCNGGNSSTTGSVTTKSPSGATTTTTTTTTTTKGATTTTTTTTTAAASSCKCGIKKSSRIVGGTETEVNEYPWIAVWADADGSGQGGCGSTLIGDKWVLTAAHCFYQNQDNLQEQTNSASNTAVVIGVHDRTTTTDTLRKVLKIKKEFIHPDYKSGVSYSNDIALFQLEEAVDLNTYSPACLPTKGQDFEGKNAWVYGWGLTQEGGICCADKLLEVEVPVVSDAVCKAALTGQSDITEDMLCAGGVKGKDACGGDSGGPLTVDVSGKHVLIGDVSFGIGCAREGLYGVYGEVSYFRDWIDQITSANGGLKTCA